MANIPMWLMGPMMLVSMMATLIGCLKMIQGIQIGRVVLERERLQVKVLREPPIPSSAVLPLSDPVDWKLIAGVTIVGGLIVLCTHIAKKTK